MTELYKVLKEPADPGNPAVVYDIAFMHRSLCISGLPVREQKPNLDGTPSTFVRKGQRFTMRMTTNNLDIPDTNTTIPIGVPYGAKARCLVLWIASQASQSSSNSNRCLEIGPIKQWLHGIGIGITGDQINLAKAQLIKLSHTNVSVTVRTAAESCEDMLVFRNDQFIASGAIATDDMYHYRDGRLDKVRWPQAISIPESTWNQFRREMVPIPMERLRMIAHSATAIDIFMYLSYRLPRIPVGEKVTVTWRQLAEQFGGSSDPKSQPPSHFKKIYSNGIQAALKAYPEARIDEVSEGLVLHHSDVASLRRAYIASSPIAPAKPTLVRKRFTAPEAAA
ncbi:replication protein RepA [Bosea sp. RAC05]|uniref:replication protein RepA n=1 Tax=Bosea sp. RAC05 TaxID=1842539 RepID=UPI00083E5BEC|nr:replication protein RepA [Bosea sp. RAC05]AOG02930.1 plasmid encoded RepA family protein [Bosea sp. RAC05]